MCSECLEPRSSEYQVCKDCHSSIGRSDAREKIEVCPECESENISKGRRTEDMCPRCHSGRIVLLEEKRRNLAQELRHSIMNIQYGHTKLRDFANRLDSAKRILVSLRMANFLHYHWLEEKIESIQEDLPAIKNRIGNQAEIVARRMAAETTGLIDYNRWTPEQFPFIEGVTNRVSEISNHYKQNVNDALEEVKPRLKDVSTQLEGLSYHRTEFKDFYEHVELSVNELPVCALPEIKVVGSNFLKNDKAEGTLFITNKRLIFIAETGRLRKKTEVVFDFPLVYLKEIEEVGRLTKKLVLRLKQGNLRISCNEETKKVLPDYLEIARRFEKYMQTDMQRVRKIEQKSVSISDVRLKIEGLVYTLLSGSSEGLHENLLSRRPFGAAREPDPNRFRDYAFRKDYHDNSRRLRNHLDRTTGRVDHAYPGRNQELETLRRDAIEIDDAIDETIRLMRNGHLVTEDFIRRYRGLMRDSYHTKRELERITREMSRYRW
ncbi:MAG: hypothetical protein ACXADO_04980 [Candidatus Thorarchaeota archaeon]